MKKPKWFYDPVFHANIYVFNKVSRVEAAKYLAEQLGVESDYESWRGNPLANASVISIDNHKCLALWFKDWKPDKAGMTDLHHEAIHASRHILCRSGVTMGQTEYDDEILTYHSDFIFENCLKAFGWK